MKMRLGLLLAILAAIALVYSGCMGAPMGGVNLDSGLYAPNESEDTSGEVYDEITELPFVSATEQATSNFSLFHSTASYSILRSSITGGGQITPDMVRIEEMLNYFSYDYPAPAAGEDFSVTTEIAESPWNDGYGLVSVGIRAREVTADGTSFPPSNIVLLADVSGSMRGADRIDLLKSAFKMLAKELGKDDRVSIVTYASGVDTKLMGAKGSETSKINKALDKLKADGATFGSGGIQSAYKLAKDYFIPGGNNRVIIASDGDFNVGLTGSELFQLIEQKRETGIYLSVLGFGRGNYQDLTMERMAAKGNGNYSYIDSLDEARKVLVDERSGLLFTVAKDAKAQAEFNPAKIRSYRLLGYEHRMLTDEEFEDYAADAGEIGSGHVAVAVYEVIFEDETGIESTMADDFLRVTLRYKEVTEDEAQREVTENVGVSARLSSPTSNMLFQSSVIETALVLRNSQYATSPSLLAVRDRLAGISELSGDTYKAEFKILVNKLIEFYDYE